MSAGPATAASTGSCRACEVYPLPVTHIFPPIRPRFSNLHSSHQQNGEANDENLLDRSSFRHLDSPPRSKSRLMWKNCLLSIYLSSEPILYRYKNIPSARCREGEDGTSKPDTRLAARVAWLPLGSAPDVCPTSSSAGLLLWVKLTHYLRARLL